MRFKSANTIVVALLGAMGVVALGSIAMDLREDFWPEPSAEPLLTADGKPCVTDDANFWTKDGANSFVVKLANACEVRQRCTVSVYIVGAKGPQQGSATLTLAPKSKGADAEQSYVMPTASAGGMANVSRQCRRA